MIIALSNSDGFETKFRKYEHRDEHVTVNFKQYRKYTRTWTNRLEDRKYYLANKCIAHNRKRRTNQAKNHLSLEEYRQQHPKAQLIIKPGRQIMKQSEKNMTFRCGDIICCPKRVVTVQYYMLRHKEIITVQFGKIKQKYCTKILNNSGMCVI